MQIILNKTSNVLFENFLTLQLANHVIIWPPNDPIYVLRTIRKFAIHRRSEERWAPPPRREKKNEECVVSSRSKGFERWYSVNQWDRSIVQTINRPLLNIGSCRAVHHAALAAQARHAITGRAGPGTITIRRGLRLGRAKDSGLVLGCRAYQIQVLFGIGYI